MLGNACAVFSLGPLQIKLQQTFVYTFFGVNVSLHFSRLKAQECKCPTVWQLQVFPGDLGVKNLSANAGDEWLILGNKILWRRTRQPTPVFLPGESQGEGSLVGCGLWGRTESDTTEATQQQQQQDFNWTFPGGASGKESTCQCRRPKRHKFDPWVGKIPWNRKWHLIPVFLPGKFHGQRSLAGSAKSQTRVSD